MSEPDISTLARRLAEQNNVDWRALKGSGPSGKVVERDVLDYLARVMAGEEALDPTPEPLPDGMEAWPDQDLRSFQEGLGESASDMREFRNDMAASVEPSLDAPAGPPDADVLHVGEPFHPGGQPEAGGQPDTGGQPSAGEAWAGQDRGGEDVTFERDVEGVRSAGEAYAAHEAERGNGAPIDEDIFLFDDDEDAGAAETPEEPAAGAGDTPFGFEQPAGAAAAADQDAFAASAGVAADFDAAGEPDDLLVVEGDDEGDAFPPAPGDVDAGGVWQDEVDATPSPGAEPAWEGEEIRIGRDAFGLEDPGEGAADDDLWVDHDAPAAEPAGAGSTDAAWAGPAQGTADADLWETRDGAEASPHDDGADRFDAPAAESADVPPPPVSEEAPGAEVTAAEAETFASTGRDAAPEVGDVPAAGAAAAGIGADATRALPLARTTTLLRRHIDVSALAAAQLAVGQELGEEEPLGASAFLLRAVAKAARDVSFDGGQVALAVIGEGVRLRRVDEAASRSFGSLVAELREAGVDEDEIGLVAADLSGLDLDEAVLDVAAPVVTLGRILYDNQRGAYRSTLSLAGDLPLELGARLLARVADLLDAPVRLVL